MIAPLGPGPVQSIYPSHPLLHDLYIPGTPNIPCSRSCTAHVPLISFAQPPGPIHPRCLSHPLLQDLYTPGTPHIPCSRTYTPQVPLTSLAAGPPLHLNLIYPLALDSTSMKWLHSWDNFQSKYISLVISQWAVCFPNNAIQWPFLQASCYMWKRPHIGCARLASPGRPGSTFHPRLAGILCLKEPGSGRPGPTWRFQMCTTIVLLPGWFADSITSTADEGGKHGTGPCKFLSTFQVATDSNTCLYMLRLYSILLS